eukprot:gene5642-6338_t
MSMSDIIMRNLIPKNFLDCEEDMESWAASSTGTRNYQRSTMAPGEFPFQNGKHGDGFSVFQDYFGLSNLLQNVKISEDNPLIQDRQTSYSGGMFSTNRSSRRLSWESDGSDPTVVISPTMPNAPGNYNGDFTDNFQQRNQMQEAGFKNLPPPSMRLNKAMRDQIINGSYQNQLNNNRQEHILPPGVVPPTSNVPQRQPTNVQVCVFCRNNGETEAVYSSHILKDAEGRTTCPILRAYTCPICKANGDNSHTIKYCPLNQHVGRAQLPSPGPIGSGSSRNIRPSTQPMTNSKLKPRC